MKHEILYGIHPVSEALKVRRREFLEIYISGEKISRRVESMMTQVEFARIPVKKISPQHLNTIAKTDKHQGLCAKVSPYPTTSVNVILDKAGNSAGKKFLLILDNLVDPRNLGAIVRTALCVGVDGIIIPKNRSALPTPLVSKASAGALEHVLLSKVTNLADTINILKKEGVWIVGMEKNAGQSLYECDLRCDLAIIIGGEEKGIRPLVKKKCDFLTSIPQLGKVSSLNASVAGAVVMYEVLRQRNAVERL